MRRSVRRGLRHNCVCVECDEMLGTAAGCPVQRTIKGPCEGVDPTKTFRAPKEAKQKKAEDGAKGRRDGRRDLGLEYKGC